MDQREHQLQSLSICHRLYNFIMKTIVSQALKTMPLGPPQPNHGHQIAHGRPCKAALSGAEEVPTIQGSGDDTISSPYIIKDNNDLCIDSGRRPEVEAPISTIAAQLPKAPKKMVSINEVVEEIRTPKKSKKNSKATRKSNSFDREEDNQKPLKSILKLPFQPTEQSDSFVNRSSD